MGRFSPRPHNLAPYMKQSSGISEGLLRGLKVSTDIVDQGRRTTVYEKEAESRAKMREAQIASLEDALFANQMERSREWDFRPEAEVVAEGPSSSQGMPQGETQVPNVRNMPGPPSSRAPKPEERQGWIMDYDPNERVPVQTEGGSTPMPGPGATETSHIPIIQGTNIPGDRFPRVPVPGGSVLAQPRSYHQKEEALRGAHEELYGNEMPGVSATIAQGLQPYKPPTGRRTIAEDLALYEAKKLVDEQYDGPDATDRNRSWALRDAQAQNFYNLALEAAGGDMDVAAQQTRDRYPDARFDTAKGAALINTRRRRRDTILRLYGPPPSDIGWWAIDQIMDYNAGTEDVLDILRSHPDTADQAEGIQQWLGNDSRIEALKILFSMAYGGAEGGGGE